MESKHDSTFEAGKTYLCDGRKWDTVKVLDVKIIGSDKWVKYHYLGKDRRAKVINVGGNDYCSEWFKAKYDKLEKAVYAENIFLVVL